MSRRCTCDVGNASVTSAWRKSGCTLSRIADVSAMQRDPPIPSTPIPTPSGRLRTALVYFKRV
eukprot:5610837-Pyramimonas_sp.AAC.1